MKLWTKKYKPERISDVPIKESVKIKNFVLNPKKKALLIYGKTGIGKTALVYALANELNYEVIEVNCSESRNKESIYNKIGNASRQKSLFSNGKIILIDEVDCISGKSDYGGMQALIEIIEKSEFPVILTANNPWESKLSALRSKCELLEIKDVDEIKLFNILKEICKKENVRYDEEALKILATRSGSDIRAAINDLHSLSLKGMISKEDLEGLYERERTESIFNLLKLIFKSRRIENVSGILRNSDMDLNEIGLWIDENLPLEYKGKELFNAYERLSQADIFNGRIMKRQYYRFLVYVDALLSVGVALAKKEKKIGFVAYKRTDRILKLWIAKQKYSKKREIAKKISNCIHCSEKKVLNEFEYYKRILNNPEIFNELKLEKEEIEYLEK